LKISFKLPIEKDIIIFDKECSDEIADNVLKEGYKYTILDTRSYLIYLNPLFIIRYIYLLIKNLNFKEKITRQLFHIYFLNIVGYINPRIVITYIDNNSVYLWLAQNYNDCEFIAIQNGIRQNYNQIELSNWNHQHFYCFGDYDIKKHSDLGCTIDKGYSVGSFRAGLLLSNSKFSKKKYDICIISSDGRRNPNSIEESLVRNVAINNRKIDSIIKQYVVQNNLKLAIALSTDTDYEKKYYKSFFGENIELIERRHSLSTYETIGMSNISISFMSTLVLEAIALGNKGISIHCEDTDFYFDYPNEIKYLYKDYALFNKYMNDLLEMTDLEYVNKIKIVKEYVMNNDSKNPPHRIIRKHIENIIGKRK
jgi:surface carbohydrate biosynthesis protein